jgi:hypothetical protein
MQIRLSIIKDTRTLSSGIYEIRSDTDFEKASTDIWRQARQAQPLTNPKDDQFLGGLDDLWNAAMKLDKVS